MDRLKFDAFSILLISKIPFFDNDKLPIISEIPIYWLLIICHQYIVHPYHHEDRGDCEEGVPVAPAPSSPRSEPT